MKWESSIAQMPGMKSIEYVDERGHTLKSTSTIMPGVEITMLAADEQLAKLEMNPSDILAGMLVSPDQPIVKPRQARQLTYLIRLTQGPLPEGIEMPSTGYQDVTWLNNREARVTVNLDAPVDAADDLPGEAERGASILIDASDPRIIELVNQALGDQREQMSPRQRAERLRAFVQGYISVVDLSVGMGSASETARTRQGDCSEHAVLLAAMLRAADIPSRTASGLIYVEEFLGHRRVFGGHMWTQAWLPRDDGADAPGQWIDLDATLPHNIYDAAHITLAVSPLADGEVINHMVSMLTLLGGLDIQVIDTPQ